MSPSLLRHSLCGLLAATLLGLTGCVTADPEYTRNFNAITDTNYPSRQILGDWVQIGGGKEVDTDGSVVPYEARVYLHFNADGTGLEQSYRKHGAHKVPTITENEFTWKYLGKNRWTQQMWGKRAREVSMTPGWHLGSGPTEMPDPIIYRFHDDRLYPTDVPNTYVRLTEEAVRQQSRRIRGLLAE